MTNDRILSRIYIDYLIENIIFGDKRKNQRNSDELHFWDYWFYRCNDDLQA